MGVWVEAWRPENKTKKLQKPNRYLRRKNKVRVNFKTGRFDNIDLAVIISSVSKAVQKILLLLTVLVCLAYTADDDS